MKNKEERKVANRAILVCIVMAIVAGITILAIHFSRMEVAIAIYAAWIVGSIFVLALLAMLWFYE